MGCGLTAANLRGLNFGVNWARKKLAGLLDLRLGCSHERVKTEADEEFDPLKTREDEAASVARFREGLTRARKPQRWKQLLNPRGFAGSWSSINLRWTPLGVRRSEDGRMDEGQHDKESTTQFCWTLLLTELGRDMSSVM